METTKEKILSVTINLLKDSTNYGEITLNKVALSANIGKSTIYDYFKSKEELLEETILYLLKKYDQILFNDFKNCEFNCMFYDQLKRVINVCNDARIIAETLFNDHKNLMPIDSTQIDKNIEIFKNKFIDRLTNIFQCAINEKIIINIHYHKYKKFVVISIISGLIFQYINGQLEISEDELIELIKKECLITMNY